MYFYLCINYIERTSLPFFTMAQEVSSQLDSIPNTMISFIFFLLSIYILIPNAYETIVNIPFIIKLITGEIIILAIPKTHIAINTI